MATLADREIAWLAQHRSMIEPFSPYQVRREHDRGIISYGLSSYGYDARLDHSFKLFTGRAHNMVTSVPLDPKAPDPFMFEGFMVQLGQAFAMPSRSFILGRTLETFKIPRDVHATVVGKSTYARAGLVMVITPLEPEWRGKVTLELHNPLSNPLLIYPGEGICQIMFHQGIDPHVTYGDRKGKYQDQSEVTLGKV